MGFIQKAKEFFKKEDGVKRVASKVGETIGKGVGKTASAAYGAYQKHYGAEGRKNRIEQNIAKAKEYESKARLKKAEQQYASAKTGSWGSQQKSFDFLTGSPTPTKIKGKKSVLTPKKSGLEAYDEKIRGLNL